MKIRLIILAMLLLFVVQQALAQPGVKGVPASSEQVVVGVKVGEFEQEERVAYAMKDGLPSDDVRSVAVTAAGKVYTATTRGLAQFAQGRWVTVAADGHAVEQVATSGDAVWFISTGKLSKLHGESFPLPTAKVNQIAVGARLLLATDVGLYMLDRGKWVPDASLERLLGTDATVRQVAVATDGRVALAAMSGLFLKPGGGKWQQVYPRTATRSWAPYDVRGVTFDAKGRLWFASIQGAGCQGEEWHLYTGADGLPYNDFTTMTAGENGTVWFGTHMGAIRYDGSDWEYRQGLRWLPNDDVRSIAVNAHGDAWLATSSGVGLIQRRPITLAEKAKFFEDQIDKYNRRTPYQYITFAYLKHTGDLSEWTLHDSDNDGLWTAMYGAGECFAYAATHDPVAKKRAKQAFEALRFLRVVTQGGQHPAPPGFIARSILPTSGPDPNLEDTPERDARNRATDDPLWKVIVPRWPVSADGEWYWKTDASSDELDGHFFFYGLYYDLVADTEAERNRVREQVSVIVGHLIEHNFQLVDHDGLPTRWAIFNPENLNHRLDWRVDRGINSLSMLAYLNVAEHITGDPRFAAAARLLIQQHAYAQNVLIPKSDTGPGSGNESDDEMIFMNYYNLIRYETDPVLRETYTLALYRQWQWQQQELNPLFDFIYGASCVDRKIGAPFAAEDLSPKDNGWLKQSVDTLKRFPLDRLDWRLTNSHRIDIIRLPPYVDLDRDVHDVGYRVNGEVLPIDERWVGLWNTDPWELDEGDGGRTLADGEAFLLPYYMGLYHRYVRE